MKLPLRNSRLKLSQGKIFWREVGKGPILVFLHGSWNDGNQWLPVMEYLNPTYHCLAPDLLGFGESEQPDDIHYSIELQLEYLAEFLVALNLRQQVYLVGHSLGGWIAASYALKYPEQVRGLVLFAPEGVQVKGVGNNWWLAQFLLARPKLVTWTMRSLQFFAQVKIASIRTTAKRFLTQLQQLLDSPAACQLLFQRRPSEIEAELLNERLPELQVPVLILQGDNETPAALALNQVYAQLLPQVKLQKISGGGNDLPQEQPDEVAQHVRYFVSSH